MPPDDAVRIGHMIEAAESAIEFVRGRARSDLDTDRMLRFALVQAIQILGEAASKLSDETRAANDMIPWKAIIGMRNRLVHAYFDIDTDVVWITVTQEIPAILQPLRKLAASV
jgi:uncharacterized protein with HEPN domain